MSDKVLHVEFETALQIELNYFECNVA